MSEKNFKVIYERKGHFLYVFPTTVYAGYEIIKAKNIGDAYKQAQHHLGEHGWMSQQFDSWRVRQIMEEWPASFADENSRSEQQ